MIKVEENIKKLEINMLENPTWSNILKNIRSYGGVTKKNLFTKKLNEFFR